MPDNINSPSHYTAGQIETIEYIQDSLSPDEYRGYLHGNAQKYLSRHKHKGKPVEDLQKLIWYANKLISTYTEDKNEN